VQFRQWASTHIKEFLRKDFVMDDERLKNPKMGMIKPNMGTTSTTSSPRNLSDALFSGTKQRVPGILYHSSALEGRRDCRAGVGK
jgi:hypothetical protein